jgi:tetratricopeptide (TPR) repeat protein/8-oxo-dGTP pyrophosphatase MutT (NUDIX family)
MTQPFNPYVAGRPLRKKRGFFGRKDTVKWVSQELLNLSTNALVLFGQRRIGKTTLLLQLERILATDDFLPVYFDLQDQAECPLDQVLVNLADVIAEHVGLELPHLTSIDKRGNFFRRDFLPKLYQVLKEGCRPIFLLDEFDVLHQTSEEKLPQNMATRALFPFLRDLMNKEPRLAFVFAVGRRAEDLSIDFTSFFKGALVQELWVLDDESSKSLILQAQTNGTLNFADQAVDHILSLTGRHPYMTQLLCHRIWERAYAKNPTSTPEVTPSDVEASVPDALEAGKSALLWLWQGLNPAERIYVAALAEAAEEENQTISEDEVVHVLGAQAARLRTQVVELASRGLDKRRVLVKSGDREYKFAIELLRRWVRRYHPLHDVKDELDQMYPLAEELFNIGQRVARKGEWKKAVEYFRDALEKDPRHFNAHLQLGEALLKLDQVDKAVAELEEAYELDRNEARFPLARGLVAKAKALQEAGDEDGALAACTQALEVSPKERGAQEIREDIWIQRGNASMEQGELDMALAAYQQAGAKKWKDAVRFVQQALENTPFLFRTRFYLGEVLLELGQTKEAMARLEDTIEICQRVEFNHEEAIDFFQSKLESQPQNVFAQLHLGELLRAKGQIEEAVEQLEQAYNVDATKVQSYLVNALTSQAQKSRAAENWLTVLGADVRILQVDPSRLDILAAIDETICELKKEKEKPLFRPPDEQGADDPFCVSRKQLEEQILPAAEHHVYLLGVVALELDWAGLAEKWVARFKNTTDFEVTVLCESDNLLFTKSLTLDTDMVENRRSFRDLKFIRDRALNLPTILREAGIPDERIEDIEVKLMHLPIPISIVQIDGRIFANLWLHEIDDHFEEITDDHPWHLLIKNYVSIYFDLQRGRKYTCEPSDELLELYDHNRTPRGIYPRESFYDTDYSQLVVWSLVFDRRGQFLIHRRSDNAKDNQGMWDKSVGGHIEFTDYHTSQAAYREVIEELFTEEPEDIKSDLKKWTISGEEMIYLGEWRPDARKWYPFREICSFEREWCFFRLPEVEGFERLYSPRRLLGGKIRRLRVIPDIFLFIAGPQLTEDFLGRLKNSTFKLVELSTLKSVMDRAIRGEEVLGFDQNRFDENKVKAIPEFTPDLEQIMTGKLRDVLDEFSRYIKRYIKT